MTRRERDQLNESLRQHGCYIGMDGDIHPIDESYKRGYYDGVVFRGICPADIPPELLGRERICPCSCCSDDDEEDDEDFLDPEFDEMEDEGEEEENENIGFVPLNANNLMPLHFKTADEWVQSLLYLGEDLAFTVVNRAIDLQNEYPIEGVSTDITTSHLGSTRIYTALAEMDLLGDENLSEKDSEGLWDPMKEPPRDSHVSSRQARKNKNKAARLTIGYIMLNPDDNFGIIIS